MQARALSDLARAQNTNEPWGCKRADNETLRLRSDLPRKFRLLFDTSRVGSSSPKLTCSWGST